jgi:UDP-N-acetyl-D-glucosamine dehydrogenase
VPALKAGAHGPASKSVALSAASLRPFDCVVIVTNHSAIDYQKVVDGSRIVVDTRDATRGIRRGRSKVVGL